MMLDVHVEQVSVQCVLEQRPEQDPAYQMRADGFDVDLKMIEKLACKDQRIQLIIEQLTLIGGLKAKISLTIK